MSRKPDSDGRQRDFFGAPAAGPKPPTGQPPAAKPPRARVPHGAPGEAGRPEPRVASPAPTEEPEGDSLHGRIARLSPAEWREVAATLTDDALGQLTLAAIRQLKRRLSREGRHGGKGRKSSLTRAAEQLVAEFGGHGEEDDF